MREPCGIFPKPLTERGVRGILCAIAYGAAKQKKSRILCREASRGRCEPGAEKGDGPLQSHPPEKRRFAKKRGQYGGPGSSRYQDRGGRASAN